MAYGAHAAGGGGSAQEPGVKVNTLLDGRGIIWGMDFLPDGELIFTEKAGKMFRFKNGTVTEITGVPTVNTNGQGGLLDIKIDPDYTSNGWLYCSYAAPGAGGDNQGFLTLARFKLNGNQITGLETLLKASTPDTWFNHYGSRIVFDNKGYLYLSVGEGGTTTYGGAGSPNMNAQNVKVEWGKVHRMTRDGKVPADNPVLPGNTAPTTVYTYGHRNPQGLLFNTLTNEVWENEHGPRGGDESEDFGGLGSALAFRADEVRAGREVGVHAERDQCRGTGGGSGEREDLRCLPAGAPF